MDTPAENKRQKLSLTSEELTFSLKNGKKIAAKRWGKKDSPIVIAVHGWLDNANSFNAIAPLLQDKQVYAIDLLGHGLSDHLNADQFYYPWEDAITVIDIIDQICTSNQPVALIGHSAGGGVATIVASYLSRRAKQLVLIDSLGIAFTSKESDIAKHFTSAMRRLDMVKRLGDNRKPLTTYGFFHTLEEAVRERCNGFSGKLSEYAARNLTIRAIQQADNGYQWRTDPKLVYPSPVQLSDAQSTSFITSVSADLLIILGDEGLFNTPEKQQRLHYFSQENIKILPGGHHLHLEESANDVADLIQAHLK